MYYAYSKIISLCYKSMWLAIEKYVITERHSEIGQPTAAYLIRETRKSSRRYAERYVHNAQRHILVMGRYLNYILFYYDVDSTVKYPFLIPIPIPVNIESLQVSEYE